MENLVRADHVFGPADHPLAEKTRKKAQFASVRINPSESGNRRLSRNESESIRANLAFAAGLAAVSQYALDSLYSSCMFLAVAAKRDTHIRNY